MPTLNSPAAFLSSLEGLPDEAVVQRTLSVPRLTAGQWRKILDGTDAKNTTEAAKKFIDEAMPPGEGAGPSPQQLRDAIEEAAQEAGDLVRHVLATSLRARLAPLARSS